MTRVPVGPTSRMARAALWGRDSGHTYAFTRKPDGTTDLDVVVVGEGKNVRGRALAGKTINAIEARNGGAAT